MSALIDRIYGLARKGHDLIEISATVGLTPGEVYARLVNPNLPDPTDAGGGGTAPAPNRAMLSGVEWPTSDIGNEGDWYMTLRPDGPYLVGPKDSEGGWGSTFPILTSESSDYTTLTDRLNAVESAPGATPALGENWRDVTADRARGAWFKPSADHSVQVNWVFFNNGGGYSEVSQIRIAADDVNGAPDWANAVDIEGTALPMPTDQSEARFSGIIPAGMNVQVNGTASVNFRSALELYL